MLLFNVENSSLQRLRRVIKKPLTDVSLFVSRNIRESLNVGCNVDTKTRPLGSPRLGIASLTKASDYRYIANIQRVV